MSAIRDILPFFLRFGDGFIHKIRTKFGILQL